MPGPAMPQTSADVRRKLVEALQLDLVGPGNDVGDPAEVLTQAPSRWYLTGFLVPLDAAPEQKLDADSDDDLDATPQQMGIDDDAEPEPAPIRQRYLPSSMGASVLVPPGVEQLEVRVLWGDYTLDESDAIGKETWKRAARQADLKLPLDGQGGKAREFSVPEGDGLKVAVIVRRVDVNVEGADLPEGLRTASVFLVNRRAAAPDTRKDEAFAFQTCLEIHAPQSFVPRPDLRGLRSTDWDERIADLQYRDVGEFAVGHNIATEAVVSDGACKLVRTTWIPQGQVERVAAAKIEGVTLSMDALSRLADGIDARAKLQPMVELYGKWIGRQDALIPSSPARRNEIGKELLSRARFAADRIDKGIALLDDPVCLEAFRLANKVMAAAARRRFGVMQGKPAESVEPAWRPFQLAFMLMNLRGISDPAHDDREVVDLLFFPTGGGKTEAYLGLAAYTLLLRRLRDPSVGSAGVAVLMRYTLRLLTLDQLGRAATLICALELERQQDVTKLGGWPFEIGLWVGRAATPNRMGSKDDNYPDTARRKTIAYWNDSSKSAPIPLEECPWCGTKFQRESFRLSANGKANRDNPTDLTVACLNRKCDFTRDRPLPILAVDDLFIGDCLAS